MPSLPYSVLHTRLTYYSLYKDLMSKVCLEEIYIYIQGPMAQIPVNVHDSRGRNDKPIVRFGCGRIIKSTSI